MTPAEQYAAQQMEVRRRLQRGAEQQASTDDAVCDEQQAESILAQELEYQQRYATESAHFQTTLFPAEQLNQRNSVSRKDGYWPFVGRKEAPPQDFTYGEFPLPFFSRLVDRACELCGIGSHRSGSVLLDLGSGAGRLVLWAASTNAWRSVVGVEYLHSLAVEADSKLQQARGTRCTVRCVRSETCRRHVSDM